ncbi:MAG: hypothetical protein CMN76_12255 [Spirochaetaceae bacterium]|nr:hypothetical protein [Spirochaetaceae bacterium]
MCGPYPGSEKDFFHFLQGLSLRRSRIREASALRIHSAMVVQVLRLAVPAPRPDYVAGDGRANGGEEV